MKVGHVCLFGEAVLGVVVEEEEEEQVGIKRCSWRPGLHAAHRRLTQLQGLHSRKCCHGERSGRGRREPSSRYIMVAAAAVAICARRDRSVAAAGKQKINWEEEKRKKKKKYLRCLLSDRNRFFHTSCCSASGLLTSTICRSRPGNRK